MRVPINPRTQVPTGELGYERAVDVTAGQRALAAVVDKYAQYAEDEQKKRELFDVQKLLVDETNNIQQDFEEKKKVQPLGAPNFTQQVNGEYNTRHQQMVEDLKRRGYSEDAVNEFATRLGTIRSQYVAQAIDFQEKSNFTKVVSDSDQMALTLSQIVNQNPNSLGSALDEFRVALSNSGLSQPEQEQIYDKQKEVIRRGALEGFAVQHPETVLGLYGFPNELKTVPNQTTGTLVNLGQAQQSVATQFTDAGFNPNVVAGFLGNFHVEGGYDGKKGDGGKASGIAQWRDERRANFQKMFGKDPSEATPEENAKFVVWEMQHPKEAGMTVAQRDQILAADTPQKAAELIDKFYERSSGKDRQKRIDAAVKFVSAHADQTIAALRPIPKDWKGNIEDAIQELGMTADQAKTFLSTGKDTRVPGQPNTGGLGPQLDTETAQSFGIQPDAQGKTGIAVLDLASGPERMQMLTLARTVMNERIADQKAAQNAEHEKFYNDFLNNLQDGKYGQSDLNAAYQNGLITDFDERRKAQAIIDEKNKKDDDLARFHLMLASGQKFNPYDPDAKKAADAGFANAVKFSAQHGNFADPFVIGLRTWQRTGIIPSQFSVMLRGGLVSTDASQVGAAAAVANNMLKENPNAFAGVEGQADIEHNAVAYGHYVYDFGMSPDEAARRVANDNDPKVKAQFKYNDPVKQEALKTLRQNGVDATQVFKDSKFPNQDMLNEANQTYYELIGEQLNRGLDLPTAMAQAGAQMQKVYGTNRNGRIVKYPPERVYPQVNGSWDYIYSDALQTVKAETGRDPVNINLVPIPGVTDEDFRNGRLARYRLIYSYQADGHTIVDSVPGEFAADIDQARRQATIASQKAFVAERKKVVDRGTPVIFPGIGEVR